MGCAVRKPAAYPRTPPRTPLATMQPHDQMSVLLTYASADHGHPNDSRLHGRKNRFLQWSWDSRAVDQGGQVRPELDSAVVPSVRGQPGASVSVHSGVQPWELPSPAVSAQGRQALVAAERAGQADQDGRPSGAARAAIDLSVVRGVGSSTVVRECWIVSAGYRRRQAEGGYNHDFAKRESAPGSRLVFNAVSPHWRGAEDDKDGQEAWFTARIASLVG